MFHVEQLDFIQMVVPWAVKDWTERGILLPSVKIAQACLETGYGASVPNNNLFGVKGSGDAHTTKEFIGGVWITIQAGFQQYATWEQSVYGQSDFLAVNPRYHNLIGNTDYAFVCDELSRAGYATDPNYASLLKSIITHYQLTQYDVEDDEFMKPVIMPDWAWTELDTFMGDAFNDGTISDWSWVDKVRNKEITATEVLFLKVFIDERRRLGRKG